MLRGSHSAKIDDKGRLKLPTAFRPLLAAESDSELFVTSVTGDSVLVYPMAAWMALEGRLAEMPGTHPARAKFVARVNYFGQVGQVDTQGRIVIQPRLREAAGMKGEVDVIGNGDHVEVWNHERLVAKLQREHYTDDDATALAGYKV